MRIGIDLGGTKIEGIALDDQGRELLRDRISTPAGDYQGTLSAVIQLVETIERKTGQQGSVGVGIPGTISPVTGLIKNANSTCLIGHPLDRDLSKGLNRPVNLANDANCFAVSEAMDGAGEGYQVVFGVILGTGVGGGLVFNHQAHVGPNAIGGEWGHNPLPWPTDDERPGPPCYCGKRGCIETHLSGPGFAGDYRRRAGADQTVQGALEICQRIKDGDPAAQQAMQTYEHRLARALAGVINIIDPDIIVLGGGLSNIDRLYNNVPKLWQDWVFSDHADTPLRKNRHGDSSGVRGAAWLWPSAG
ncbi:fructokinase [Magnetospira sp. QH-2]|uniref:fructokinase n=1 Tax=Magnetospira sp. (strain QH-2) TaxID=1288970 RepID=UPI0003E80A83|nr:fructokinase [Magnetospira sp. QH-2]CCQ74155.1 Fructokinase [Magnetospira sp. QH-2]